jgi:vacuolar-type H+-ATPase subunit E/Vma4
MAQEDLGSVLRRIDEQRSQKISEIEQATKKEIGLIIDKARKETLKMREREVNKSEKRNKAEKEQKLAHARLMNAKNSFTMKKHIMDELNEKGLSSLESYDSDRRKDFLRRLVAKASAIFGSGTIICREEDVGLLEGVGYEIQGTLGSRGGLIVIEEGGERVLDLRYETLVQEAFEIVGPEINGIMFGDVK